MDAEFIRPLIWVGLGVGIVVTFMVLEVVLRMLANSYSGHFARADRVGD